MPSNSDTVAIVAVYAFNILLLPTIGWAVWIYWTMKNVQEMLKHPDRHGFGTASLEQIIERNTIAIRGVTVAMEALVHYVEWLSENTTGKKPPPPLPMRPNLEKRNGD